jgi:predicted chitinase/peptidoglycan hydrolase-like protein with peptidoglycan-binding domain
MTLCTTIELRKFAPPPAQRQVAVRKVFDAYAETIASAGAVDLIVRYGIRTGLQFCHFMAQIGHETGGFTIQSESGNYTAKRIVEVFGPGIHSARISAAEAEDLAHDGPALFDRSYGIGNPHMAATLGNTEKGDGWKFRGRGPMQTTGRGDYAKLAEHIGIDLIGNPDLLDDPFIGLEAALWEWRAKGCNRWADDDNCAMVTRRINGGKMGLADREDYLQRAKDLWEDLPEAAFGATPQTTAVIEASPAPAMASSAPPAVAVSERAVPPDPKRPSFPPAKSVVEPAVVPKAALVPKTEAVSTNTLRPGASGPLVEILQMHLRKLGYYPFSPDGDFGDRTIEALLAFKHVNALSLSDVVDDVVWASFATAKPRDLGARAHTTEQDLRERGAPEIIRADLFQRIGAWIGLGGAGVAGANKLGLADQMKFVSDNTSLIKQTLTTVGEILTFVQHNLLPFAVVGLAYAVFTYARTNKAQHVAMTQAGLHLGK